MVTYLGGSAEEWRGMAMVDEVTAAFERADVVRPRELAAGGADLDATGQRALAAVLRSAASRLGEQPDTRPNDAPPRPPRSDGGAS